MNIQAAIAQVVAGQSLSRADMETVMRTVMQGEATEAQIGGLLVGLRMKGETIDEIVGAASVMRSLATPVDIDTDGRSLCRRRGRGPHCKTWKPLGLQFVRLV